MVSGWPPARGAETRAGRLARLAGSQVIGLDVAAATPGRAEAASPAICRASCVRRRARRLTPGPQPEALPPRHACPAAQPRRVCWDRLRCLRLGRPASRRRCALREPCYPADTGHPPPPAQPRGQQAESGLHGKRGLEDAASEIGERFANRSPRAACPREDPALAAAAGLATGSQLTGRGPPGSTATAQSSLHSIRCSEPSPATRLGSERHHGGCCHSRFQRLGRVGGETVVLRLKAVRPPLHIVCEPPCWSGLG